MVVADPGGVRIGSGASTLWCLMEVLVAEGCGESGADRWREVLANLSRVEVESLRQLLTGDGFDAEIEKLVDASQIDRQP